jgi:hypothetical protein
MERAKMFEPRFFATEHGIARGLYPPRLTAAGNEAGSAFCCSETCQAPDGWACFPLRGLEDSSWPIAFHGTSPDAVPSVIEHGLVCPGSAAGSSIINRHHGAVGSGDGEAIYLTPSLWCAGQPIYARLKAFEDSWVQVCIAVRVRPSSFVVQGNTMNGRFWDYQTLIDPIYRDNQEIEWVVKQHDDVRVVAIMLRFLGPSAERYGTICAKVPAPEKGIAAAEEQYKFLTETAFQMQGYKCPEIGRVSIEGKCASWVIPNKQVTACGPRQQMMSPKFELGGIPEMCMRFWPRGDCDLDPSEKEEVCSFRIICPKRGTYRLTLSAGYQQRYLEHYFPIEKPGQDRGWRSFCTLKSVLELPEVKLSVTLLFYDAEDKTGSENPAQIQPPPLKAPARNETSKCCVVQ